MPSDAPNNEVDEEINDGGVICGVVKDLILCVIEAHPIAEASMSSDKKCEDIGITVSDAQVPGNGVEVVNNGNKLDRHESSREYSECCKVFMKMDMPKIDDTSSDECEVIGGLVANPSASVSNQPAESSASACPPSTLSANGIATPRNLSKKSMVQSNKRLPGRDSNERLEAKINEVEKWKFECIKQIRKLEEMELPDGIEGELVLEKIDKLRKKAVQFEESLSQFISYEDAEYDEFITDDSRLRVHNKIIIFDAELEPLNALLTQHVNKLETNVDIQCGYRCVTVDNVDAMLKLICERGDCPVYDVVVPKDKEQYDNFILRIVERTNLRCRQKLFREMVDRTYLSNGVSLVKPTRTASPSTAVAENGDSAVAVSPQPNNGDVIAVNTYDRDVKPILSEKLISMKSEGLLDEAEDDEREEVIDLSDFEFDDCEASEDVTEGAASVKAESSEQMALKNDDAKKETSEKTNDAICGSIQVESSQQAAVNNDVKEEMSLKTSDPVSISVQEEPSELATVSHSVDEKMSEKTSDPVSISVQEDSSELAAVSKKETVRKMDNTVTDSISDPIENKLVEQVVKRTADDLSNSDMPVDKKSKLTDSPPLRNFACKSIVKSPRTSSGRSFTVAVKPQSVESNVQLSDYDCVDCVDVDDDETDDDEIQCFEVDDGNAGGQVSVNAHFTLDLLKGSDEEEQVEAKDEKVEKNSNLSLELKDSVEQEIEVIDLSTDEEDEVEENRSNNHHGNDVTDEEEDNEVEVLCEVKK